MNKAMNKPNQLHPDFKELLQALAASSAEYLLIGGWAVGFHSEPRLTKDMDLWIGEDATNLSRVVEAVVQFGAPASTIRDLRSLGPDEFVFFGVAPLRVDLLRKIPGVDFSVAYQKRILVDVDGASVSLIAMDDLIAAKLAAGRPQDLRDVAALRKAHKQLGR